MPAIRVGRCWIDARFCPGGSDLVAGFRPVATGRAQPWAREATSPDDADSTEGYGVVTAGTHSSAGFFASSVSGPN